MSRRFKTVSIADEVVQETHESRTEATATSQSVVEAAATSSQQNAIDAPLPRPQRRQRKSSAERGLPPDSELVKLAEHYLSQQRNLWPNLASSGLLPEPSERVVTEMVEDFKQRHRTGLVHIESLAEFRKSVRHLGGSYNRFSCDNSSTNSILDQLTNTLRKAHGEGRFIPWQYVFADYAVIRCARNTRSESVN